MIFVLKRISRTEACVRRALQEDAIYPHIELQASLKEWSDSWMQQESMEPALTNLMQSIDLVRQLCYACLTIEAIHYIEKASQGSAKWGAS